VEVYSSAADALMFALLGWLVYNGLDGALSISRVTRRHLKLDIFATNKLVPVANMSLGISLAFLGGVSIAIAFQPLQTMLHWQTAMIYAILVGVAIVIFFLSMWSTHSAIVRVKRGELATARANLELAYRRLGENGAGGQVRGNETVYSAVAAWAAFVFPIPEIM
jgi:hypothetical protein